MSNPILGFPQRGVPMIGLPFKVHGVLVNVVVECNCTASTQNKQSLIIQGIDGGAQCPECGKVYAIGRLNYDIQQRNLEVNLVVDLSRCRSNTEKTDG